MVDFGYVPYKNTKFAYSELKASENDVDFALILVDEYVKYPIDDWKKMQKKVADPINCTSDSLCH